MWSIRHRNLYIFLQQTLTNRLVDFKGSLGYSVDQFEWLWTTRSDTTCWSLREGLSLEGGGWIDLKTNRNLFWLSQSEFKICNGSLYQTDWVSLMLIEFSEPEIFLWCCAENLTICLSAWCNKTVRKISMQTESKEHKKYSGFGG